MRIGTFAEMFGVQASTVRYYIKRGFLVTNVRNKQNIFNKNCVDDMRQIMEWKQFHFSLNDIGELLTLKRKYNRAQQDDAKLYLHLMRQQEVKLKTELEAIREKLERVDELLSDFSS